MEEPEPASALISTKHHDDSSFSVKTFWWAAGCSEKRMLWFPFDMSANMECMSSLLCFLSFIPATVELWRINSDNALGWYLGAYVLGYVGGKGCDAMRRDKPE